MPPTQQEVDNYVNSLRSNRATAQSTFGSDDAEIKVRLDDTVLVQLTFEPADDTQAAKHSAEQKAIDAADDLRGWGASVNLRSRDGTVTVFGRFVP